MWRNGKTGTQNLLDFRVAMFAVAKFPNDLGRWIEDVQLLMPSAVEDDFAAQIFGDYSRLSERCWMIVHQRLQGPKN